MTGLREHGKSLLYNGYSIIPIPVGYKYPKGLPGWPKMRATPQVVDSWLAGGLKDAGVGVMNCVGIDIDLEDRAMARFVLQWCREHLGATVVRRRRDSNRALAVYRPHHLFKKLTSSTYLFEGMDQRIEVLCDGSQFVAYGVHPESGTPYEWLGRELSDTSRKALPLVNRTQCSDLLRAFEAEAERRGWLDKKVKRKGNRATENRTALESAKSKLNLPTDKLQSLLRDCENLSDDYEQWLRVGMALHHQFDGSAIGLTLWDEWSRLSPKYEDGEPANKWKTFRSDTGDPITAAFIVSEARKQRLARMEFADALEEAEARYVYIVAGKRVNDLWEDDNGATRTLEEFHLEMAPKLLMREGKYVSVSKNWVGSTRRLTARDTLYRPGMKRYFQEGAKTNGQPLSWINSYSARRFKPLSTIALKPSTVPFHEHMRYLFPLKKEREWFVDWMAFNIQKPWERCQVTPLHISTHHGTGRGWLVALIRQLLGHHNCSDATIDELCGGKGSEFNSYFDDTLFCAVEEASESTSVRYRLEERLRQILTSPYVTVNRKYGAKTNKRVYTNFFFQSNRRDALIIPKNDRRINIFSGPSNTLPDSYYTQLYALLKNEDFLAVLHDELKHRDLSSFGWQRSFDTPARRHMVEQGLSLTEYLFDCFMDKPRDGVVLTFDMLFSRLTEWIEDPLEEGLNRKQLEKLLKNHPNIRAGARMRVDGKVKRLWIFDPKIPNEPEVLRTALARSSGPELVKEKGAGETENSRPGKQAV